MSLRCASANNTSNMLLAFIDFSFETLLWAVLALLVVYLARQFFAPPPPPPRPRPAPKPIVLREYSREELSRCTGADPSTPILIAIKGKVYDVTRGRSFYGPGSAYPNLVILLFLQSLSYVLIDPCVNMVFLLDMMHLMPLQRAL